MRARKGLLVLDCHGLVLNDPWPQFLRDCARRAGADEELWTHRWRHEWRRRAWLGQMTDGELWEALCREPRERADWAGFLEPRYALGPAAAHLDRWRQRVEITLLSNHRAAWLRRRLERFDLMRRFDRLLVSDEIGVVKPEREAFERPVGDRARETVVFADNSTANVAAARAAGLDAILATPDGGWIAEVDVRLGRTLTASNGVT